MTSASLSRLSWVITECILQRSIVRTYSIDLEHELSEPAPNITLALA